MGDAKLDAVAADALARACDEARRRQHPVVDPEHLLVALCGTDGGRAALAARAVDAAELAERLESRLAGRPHVGGYRGATSEAEGSARLEDVVDRAASLARGRANVREYDLVASALGDRVIATMLASLTRWDDSATAVMTRARALARAFGHEEVGLENALRILVDEPFFATGLRDLGADLDAIRSAIEADLPRPPTKASVRALTKVHDDAQRAVSARGARCTRHGLALGLLHELATSWTFAPFGVDALELVHALTHGGPPPDAGSALPAHVMVDVVVHGDDFVTPELVVEVCERVFVTDEPHAHLYAASVMEQGSCVVGTWPAKEARERRALAMLLSRRWARPLRITLRRPGT